ncbi:hypothetical protein [Saccharopolyspora mangrovi]|uniref:Uncharacterized protein n=1 Tax=Saccharopolyspora mangrovi TaxID=3082379 RepID=A0ABU6ALL1_9PSEU|nr:hypothetical protein [Saccharopolyspora sp. S2-29]MEB3372444.1 hypothetical protein [Saccharopolyspora sp. S2-29]
MHQPPRDLVDDIEQLLAPLAAPQEPSPAANGFWDVSGPEMMRAVLLDQDRIELIEIPRADPVPAIATRVGDTLAEVIQYTPDVLIWAGEDGSRTNDTATGLVCELIADVAEGTYASTELGRAHAQRLAVTPEFVPTLYGAVVLTGATGHGEPAPFTDTFGQWFAAILDQIDRTAARIQAHAAVEAILAVFGQSRAPRPHGEESDGPTRPR